VFAAAVTARASLPSLSSLFMTFWRINAGWRFRSAVWPWLRIPVLRIRLEGLLRDMLSLCQFYSLLVTRLPFGGDIEADLTTKNC
jgi:hypothetical protein